MTHPPDSPQTAHDPLSPQCLRCEAVMVRGFQCDIGFDVIHQAKWVEGLPQRSWISGEVKTSQMKQGLPVTTFRCPACGYLESYALNPMRCKRCDYPLWNLRDRKCPECGKPFAP